MNYKILVLDIDGTLTNSQKEVTQVTKAAIRELQKKGVAVVIASGRPTYGVLPLAKTLELEKFGGYILSFNGGQIRNCKTGEIIFNQQLPKHLIGDLCDFAQKMNCHMLSYDGDCVITDDKSNRYVNHEAHIVKLPVRGIPDFHLYDEADINKCIIVQEGEYLATVEPVAVETFPMLNIFRSEPYFLEVVPKGIDKAKSLEVLLRRLNLTREEMVACGDGFNDRTMLEYAGMGVAMANAQEPVKEVADFITKSNDEDGVAYAIEQLFRD